MDKISILYLKHNWLKVFAIRTTMSWGTILKLRPRPQYAGEIWKRSFISTIRPYVHTTTQSTTFIQYCISGIGQYVLGIFLADEFLPRINKDYQSTASIYLSIYRENGAFHKRSSNRRNLKTPAFRFCVDGKHFWKRGFSKTTASR